MGASVIVSTIKIKLKLFINYRHDITSCVIFLLHMYMTLLSNPDINIFGILTIAK